MVKTYAVKLPSLRCEKMLEKLLLGVSQAKQEQASKFKNKDDAFRSVIGESLTRKVLSIEYGMTNNKVVFEKNTW